jgi:hypothetical protein
MIKMPFIPLILLSPPTKPSQSAKVPLRILFAPFIPPYLYNLAFGRAFMLDEGNHRH